MKLPISCLGRWSQRSRNATEGVQHDPVSVSKGKKVAEGRGTDDYLSGSLGLGLMFAPDGFSARMVHKPRTLGQVYRLNLDLRASVALAGGSRILSRDGGRVTHPWQPCCDPKERPASPCGALGSTAPPCAPQLQGTLCIFSLMIPSGGSGLVGTCCSPHP